MFRFQSRAALSLLGYCYYQLQDFVNAADCYEQLAANNPEVEDYKLYYAQSLYKACLNEEAMKVSCQIDNPTYSTRVNLHTFFFLAFMYLKTLIKVLSLECIFREFYLCKLPDIFFFFFIYNTKYLYNYRYFVFFSWGVGSGVHCILFLDKVTFKKKVFPYF